MRKGAGRKEGANACKERKGPYGLEQPVFIPVAKHMIFSICYPSHAPHRCGAWEGCGMRKGATLMATVRKPLWLGTPPPLMLLWKLNEPYFSLTMQLF